jgi:hypothetical protein
MKVIPREAGRTTYSTKIRNLKRDLFLSNYQKDIVIGSILGDGCLCGNWSRTNCRLKISHSAKQQDYVLWKYDILKKWFLTEPRIYKKTKSISIRTISHPELTGFYKIFYGNNTKIIPMNIATLLNPLVVAVWFMDDGNIRKFKNKIYGYYINTQSFSLIDNQKLVKVFWDNFGINCLIIKNKGKHRLYIGRDRNKFRNLIEKLIIPSMQYKIS